MANRRPPACLDTLCSPPARQLAYLMHHRLRCHQRSRQVQQGGDIVLIGPSTIRQPTWWASDIAARQSASGSLIRAGRSDHGAAWGCTLPEAAP